ncbi:type II/IV secretion system ATPase subunit [Methanolobus halotolerans]|uniref:Secretion system protein E n=1 Tax=Methanolobus halotolerans TaxID=2052935 RepID=A0A4E0PYR5_9EURY|nr:type II/IV secretion system ATPase subunit [Methanolobus halotolerans]TGC11482.1 secretion system protein E [Methanolobus halotolerans]
MDDKTSRDKDGKKDIPNLPDGGEAIETAGSSIGTEDVLPSDNAGTEELPAEVQTDNITTLVSEEYTIPASLPGDSFVIRESTESLADDNTYELVPIVDEDIFVDELADLVLPFDEVVSIEELKSKVDASSLDSGFDDGISDEMELKWEQVAKEIFREKPVEEETDEDDEDSETLKDRINKLFARKKINVDPYHMIEHGPIVDFTIPADSPYKEVELYEVNPPYAYVRIAYDPISHEFQYQALEPILREKEKELLDAIKLKFVETLDIDLKEISRKNAQVYLRDNIMEYLREYQIDISPKKRERIMYHLIRDYVGYGEIDVLMKDIYLEDISCDGPDTPIYVYHKEYNSIPTSIEFRGDDELDSFAIRIAQICGRHVSIANPLLDATMPDGSRIQMTLGREITTRGSTFTIRRFKDNPITPTNLIDFHTFSPAIMAYLWLAVESNKSLIFAGGTASGKTTAMNAVSLFIQPEMKIVSIEDTRELNLSHPNWIPGVTRQSFEGGGKGSIEMYELLRASLRQRPEYILVGEVRGAEAYVLFQAMSTGHTTFSTMHADSVQSVVHRLENPPINVPRIMIQALDLVAIQVQVKVGDERVRRCKTLTEIVGVDPRTGELLTNDVFSWDAARDMFQYSGRSYVVENVMESRGWTEERVREELKRRQDILEWAREKNIAHFKEFAKIVVTYNREPETLMKIVRQDLYG